ncbi:MAG: HAD family hydrolase [Clostridia bacterium]|nr:HAD family hydrolase [Clostridia bacterium]
MIKAVIFDLDGTLANTFDDLRSSIDDMRAAFGMGPISYEQMTSFINASLRGFAEGGLGGERTEEELQKAMQVYCDAYAKHYIEKTCIYEGLPELLASLKAKGVRLAVYSNKMAEYVKKICIKLYGENMFEVLMGPDGITPKPDPMGALLAAEKMGVAPAEAAYVGDSVTDMKTGLAAGMHTIGVSWGFTAREDLVAAGAHKIADTVDGLGNILENL